MEPFGLIFIFKHDAHPRRRQVGIEMINHKPIILYTHFLNFTIRNRPISVQDELLPNIHLIIKLIHKIALGHLNSAEK